MCLDAYDVLLNAPSATVAQVFESMDSPILFGAERGCWPVKYCGHMASVEYPPKESVAANVAKYPTYFQYPYLNSGVGLGYAWALERAFGTMLEHPVFEEQDAVTRYYLEEQRGMHAERLILLDHSARVVSWVWV